MTQSNRQLVPPGVRLFIRGCRMLGRYGSLDVPWRHATVTLRGSQTYAGKTLSTPVTQASQASQL